jgi:RHS repeat-associated protein
MIVTRNGSACGQDWDYFLRSFSYNPNTGTFTTLDPYAGDPTNPLSYNKYLYTQGDPINGSDPTGLTVELVGRALNSFLFQKGTHTFLLLIPDRPQDFEGNSPGARLLNTLGQEMQQLENQGFSGMLTIDGRRVIIVGAEKMVLNGQAQGKAQLFPEFFNASDVAAARELLDSHYTARSYRAEGIRISSFKGNTDTEFIMKILGAVQAYIGNAQRKPILYPTAAGVLGGINSNDWTAGLLEYVGAKPPGGFRFKGLAIQSPNWNPIPRAYFKFNGVQANSNVSIGSPLPSIATSEEMSGAGSLDGLTAMMSLSDFDGFA